MGKKATAAGTLAMVALSAAGVAFTVHCYQHDPAASSYGEAAAAIASIGRGDALRGERVSA